jgi:hypothetical protein
MRIARQALLKYTLRGVTNREAAEQRSVTRYDETRLARAADEEIIEYEASEEADGGKWRDVAGWQYR